MSREVLILAKVNDEKEQVIDAIPLYEIEEIGAAQISDVLHREESAMHHGNSSTEFRKMSTIRNGSGGIVLDSNKVKFKNSFEIKTLVHGFNSGRKYFFKATNEEQCADLMKNLSEMVKAAIKKKEAKTRFQESQERVRTIYSSTIFQGLVASMIVAVLPQLQCLVHAQHHAQH